MRSLSIKSQYEFVKDFVTQEGQLSRRISVSIGMGLLMIAVSVGAIAGWNQETVPTISTPNLIGFRNEGKLVADLKQRIEYADARLILFEKMHGTQHAWTWDQYREYVRLLGVRDVYVNRFNTIVTPYYYAQQQNRLGETKAMVLEPHPSSTLSPYIASEQRLSVP